MTNFNYPTWDILILHYGKGSNAGKDGRGSEMDGFNSEAMSAPVQTYLMWLLRVSINWIAHNQ